MQQTPLKRKTALRTRAVKRIKGGKKPRRKKSDLSRLKTRLWELCKQIIKQRYGNTCYSCGKQNLEGSSRHTGHFIPSSVSSVELRYSLENLRPQCYHCNINLSGNWPSYEAHLILDYGKDYPDLLKQRNQQTKNAQYDILWYQNKIAEYERIYDPNRVRQDS